MASSALFTDLSPSAVFQDVLQCEDLYQAGDDICIYMAPGRI